MTVSSSAFGEGEPIPERFTCDGDGVSPPLAWTRVPHGAHSLVLVVDDPKAGHFVHWTVLDIPPTVTAVEEDDAPRGETDNSLGEEGWTGPCPPEGDGEHEYLFAVYAVDGPLGLDEGASHDEIAGAAGARHRPRRADRALRPRLSQAVARLGAGEAERRAGRHAGVEPDAAAVVLDDLAAQRQPDPGALVRLLGVQALEDREDALRVLRRDADRRSSRSSTCPRREPRSPARPAAPRHGT